ncbi:MAG TPA: TonB-dependent receptor, partial [Promicromonospora sp.]|nr:TonB-dependent receptor [Promicromonospora sp.]
VWVALLLYGGRWLDDLRLLRSRGVSRLFGWARVPDATTFGRFLRRAAGVLVPVLDELLWHVCSGCAGGRWACRGASSLEIVLVETPLVLSGVQVTATPGGGAVWAASQATTELSGKALERNLGATLAETLQGTPGMAVRYSGPAAAAPVIRGLSGDRILVLQDGLRTGDLAGSAVDHTVTIDPLAASRVEVVRGPAALLYGNNALGGVVNVISDDVPVDAPPRAGVEAAGQAESAHAGGGIAARAAVPVGRGWVFGARGGMRRTGDVRIPEDPALGRRLANTGMESVNGTLGVGYAGRTVRAGAALRRYDFEYGLPARPGTDPLRWAGRRVEAVLRAEVELPSSGLSGVRLDATLQDYAHDEVVVAGGSGNRFELRTAAVGVRLDQAPRGPLGRGAWGVSGLWKDYTSEGATSLTPPANSTAAGVFGFQQLELSDDGAALQLGARLDRYAVASRTAPKFGPGRERVFTAASGSLGLVLPLGDAVSAALTLARAFRAPTVEELYSRSVHAGTGAVEFGNPGLEAERALGADAVMRLHSSRVTGQLAAYVNRVAGYIYPAVTGDTVVDGHALPIVGYAQHDATLRGVEGSVEAVVVRSLVVGLGGDVVSARREGGGTIPFLPPARLFFGLRWDDGARLLGARVRHAVARTRISEGDETPTDAYTLVDLEAGVRKSFGRTRHSLTVRVDNLGDVLYRDAASRIKDFAPNPGRNVAVVYRVGW